MPFEEYDPYSAYEDGSNVHIAYTIGSQTGNKITIDIPRANFTKVEDTENDGIAMANVSFIMTQDEGDDEISITFE